MEIELEDSPCLSSPPDEVEAGGVKVSNRRLHPAICFIVLCLLLVSLSLPLTLVGYVLR